MIETNSDDSDHEGFISNQIRIDERNVSPLEKPQTNFKEFQPHYIASQGVIRKEIPESLNTFPFIPNKPRSYPHKCIASIHNEHLPTARELYLNMRNYSLVYKRYKQPFGQEVKATFQHPVRLLCCQNYKQQNFKVLKEWDKECLSGQPLGDKFLVFDSRFEGGNLLCAFKAKKQLNTYILFMQNDTNTYGYNQWFYFSISNMSINTKYTFKIVNFKKRYSFFQNGLQPLIFSLTDAQNKGNGWYRDGFDISYYPSQFRQKECSPYYTAEFSLQFEHKDDYVTICPSAPYSYTKLIATLKQLQTAAIKNSLSWKLKSIAKTISFNEVPYVILSNKQVKKSAKKKILILARQHSGETWSSYLAESILQRLIEQKCADSRWLLQNYDVHIIPMINVDGVIYGNFRCDLAGYDLNRTWKNPTETIHPQIYHIKREISKLAQKYQIQLCLDLHTHSRQLGAFAYCCVDSQEGRELPQIISQCSPFFRYRACTFGISGDKRYTARAAVFNLTNSMYTITIELSAYGFSLYPRKYPIPYTPGHMKNISKAIIQGFYAYKRKIAPEVEEQDPAIVDIEEGQTISIKQLMAKQQASLQEQIPVEESDSQPEADQIELSIRINTIFPDNFIEDIAQTATKANKVMIPNQTKVKMSKVKKLNRSLNRTKVSNKFSIRKHQSQPRGQQIKLIKDIALVEPKTLEYQRNSPPVVKSKRQKASVPSQPTYKRQSNFISEKSQKISAERPSKPLNLVEFSLKKLPISVPEKIVQNHHFLLDEGVPSLAAYSYGKREDNRFDKTFSTYEAMCRPRVRLQSKKIGVVREDSRLEQQLPFLCIMSQGKKQVQMEKIKQKQEGREPGKRNQSQKHHYVGANPPGRVFETPFLKIHNNTKNFQVIQKLESDQFARYAESTYFRRN